MADETTVVAPPATEPVVSDGVASRENPMSSLTSAQAPAVTEPEPTETTQTNGEEPEKKENEAAETEKPVETMHTNGDKVPESDKPADESTRTDENKEVSESDTCQYLEQCHE